MKQEKAKRLIIREWDQWVQAQSIDSGEVNWPRFVKVLSRAPGRTSCVFGFSNKRPGQVPSRPRLVARRAAPLGLGRSGPPWLLSPLSCPNGNPSLLSSTRRRRSIKAPGFAPSRLNARPLTLGWGDLFRGKLARDRSAPRRRVHRAANSLSGISTGRLRYHSAGSSLISGQRCTCVANQPIRLFQNVGICRLFSRKKAEHHERRAK